MTPPKKWMYDSLSVAERATVKLAASIALKGGKLYEQSTYIATWSPYCLTPVQVRRRIRGREGVRSLQAVMLAPCRKCEKCLQFRQMKWRERMQRELLASRRSWFVTLTFDDVALAGIYLKAAAEGCEHVEAVNKHAYSLVQLFLKRVRKTRKIRFFAVFELGEETARPHYHLIIHEVSGPPLLARHIEDQWPWISHARLVNMGRRGLASYVTKYLTKTAGIRVRASNRYGFPASGAVQHSKR